MKVQKVFRSAASAFAVLGILVLVGGNTASALPASGASNGAAATIQGLVHEQFAATGFVTSFSQNITNPPMVGQGFTLEEVVIANSNNQPIGTDHIECRIVRITGPTSFRFACTAQYNVNAGTLFAVTSFNFDVTNTSPIMYDAFILSGTGQYQGAFGRIHVTDSGPGNPTGYVFDFYHL